MAAHFRWPGSKGPRCYDWAWITINPDAKHPGQRWLLIRRNNGTGELADHRCYAPQPVPLRELVRAAGRRWTSWQRWTVMAMLAYALLAVHTAAERAQNPPPDRLISLT